MPFEAINEPFDAEVIVVGAGPVGLTAGCALRHHEVDCLILEERTEVRAYSRANNLWARPQELLASVGLRDAIAERAYPVRVVNFSMNSTPTTPVQIDDGTSPHPQVLYSGQDVIETTLIETYEGRGGRMQRGGRVVAIAQNGDGVTVTVRRGDDGPEECLRCRYLVAADGAKSTVRGRLGLGFEPERFEGRMNRQVDAKLSWRRSLEPDQLWFFYYERGFCGVMPVWGGYHRLFFLADDAGVPDRDPTLDEIQAVAREVTGDETLTLTHPQWLTHSRFQYGVSPGYSRGRVFLAGDAGHLSLPIGGQGMNAGLHDAVEIAWRLAAELRGTAAPVVLESYDAERGGEHARLSAQQAKGFRRTVYRGPVADVALGPAAKVVPGIGALLQGTNDLQRLSVSYPKSPLNEDHLSGVTHLRQRGPRAGERTPEAEVTLGGRTSSLFPFIYNPDGVKTGWALLCFDGRSPEAGASRRAAIEAVAPWGWVRPRLVLADPACEVGGAPVLSDLDGKAHGAYGLEGQPSLVLVRPDRHIAYRDAAGRPERLAAYCRRISATACGETA
jgi:3-(3-hydroxy-phenyl)propionate hydroxylase